MLLSFQVIIVLYSSWVGLVSFAHVGVLLQIFFFFQLFWGEADLVYILFALFITSVVGVLINNKNSLNILSLYKMLVYIVFPGFSSAYHCPVEQMLQIPSAVHSYSLLSMFFF